MTSLSSCAWPHSCPVGKLSRKMVAVGGDTRLLVRITLDNLSEPIRETGVHVL